MTNEEAIKRCKHLIQKDKDVTLMVNGRNLVLQSYHADAIEVAIEALEKQEKYRWHNLIDDPNDLPEKYLTLGVSVDVVVYDITGYYHDAFYSYYKECWASSPHKVIAWKYIEPFELSGE